MIKRNPLAWILLALLLAGSIGIVRRTSVNATVEPFFRFVYDAKNNPVDGPLRVPIPNKCYLHAAVAVDQSGNFYILASKRDTTNKIPGVPSAAAPERIDEYVRAQQNIIHVLVVNAKGQIQRTVPLRRLDGRAVRSSCDFLAVSSSSERWWTLRQALESPEDWKDRREVEKRTVLLNAYDHHGKPLGEWQVPIALAGETFAVAAIGNEAYVIPEALEQEKQLLIYSIGSEQPIQRPWPGSWLPKIGGSFVTLDEQFWHLIPHEDGNVEAHVTALNGTTRLFTTFQWHHKGFSPFLFWADTEDGLFVFEHLKDEKGNIRFSDGAKAVYRVTPDGKIQKLFETPDVLKSKLGYQVRAGQPLKADENFVWLEAEYLKGDKVTEYQIVKVKYQ